MKNIILSFLLCLLCPAAVCAMDGPSEKVKLNVESAKVQSVPFESFGFCFKLEEEKDSVRISVSLKNVSQYAIVLFHKSGNEDSLKKNPLRIRFDKSFSGTKGTRSVEQFPCLEKDRIVSQDVEVPLFSFMLKEGDTSCFTAPVYIAVPVRKSIAGGNTLITHSLIDMKRVEFMVVLEKFVDERISQLNSEYERLIEMLDTVRFCPNEAHQPSLEVQKSKYKTQVDGFRARVDSAAAICGYGPKRLVPYKELSAKVSGINLDDEKRLVDCGEHQAKHKCEWCGRSLYEIYEQLDEIYNRIQHSDDRVAEKNRYWSRIKSMYECVREAERPERNGDERLKRNINVYYNEIQGIR